MRRFVPYSFLLAAAIATFSGAEAVPRPEHPNPQAVRIEWLNLNGAWEYAESNEAEDEARLSDASYPERIVVPFCRESQSSGLERKGFVKNVWYRRSFERPASWTSPRTRLHIGACDWRTRVWVNGTLVGTHTGGNAAFAFDVTDALVPGTNTVIVHAFDDTAGGLQALGKQSNTGTGYGIFYTPTTGIWQTVWLEGVGSTFVAKYHVVPVPEDHRLHVNVAVDGPTAGLALRVTASSEGTVVGSVTAPLAWRDNRFEAPVPNPRLWSPSDPFLYGLVIEILRGQEVIDRLDGYFGMRRVTVEGDGILINGQRIFQRLVLDQGFYPGGIWTAPSDAALKGDIELSMACGFNGARLHQKVFEPRFLYWADKLGYLVWGEFPSYGANYDNPAVHNPIVNEWVDIVERDRNHPAIIGWCPFNETPPGAGPLQATVINLTRALDPSRPVIETSGWTHTIPDPEVLDAHDYDQEPKSFRARWQTGYNAGTLPPLPARYGIAARPPVPFMISEYGGIGWGFEGEAWGYGNAPATLEEFYARLDGLTRALLGSPRLFGFCYTQLTNIEQEQNGLYFYDRKPKFDAEKLRAIFGAPAAYERAAPAAAAAPRAADWTLHIGSMHDGEAARPWRYTTEAPAADWAQPGFDAGAWPEAPAPFGRKGGDWRDKVRTPWTSDDLWLRQTFAWDGEPFDDAVMVLHHDDACGVTVNGQPLWSSDSWIDRYDAFEVTEALRAALRPGENVVAVHVRQERGGQYLDLALLTARRK